MSTETQTIPPAEEAQAIEKCGSSALKMIGWFSVGMAVAAVGILVGVELRSRYKFNRRTPYDFYSHADETQAGEFGVGV